MLCSTANCNSKQGVLKCPQCKKRACTSCKNKIHNGSCGNSEDECQKDRSKSPIKLQIFELLDDVKKAIKASSTQTTSAADTVCLRSLNNLAREYDSSPMDTSDLYRIKDSFHPKIAGHLHARHKSIFDNEWAKYIEYPQTMRMVGMASIIKANQAMLDAL